MEPPGSPEDNTCVIKMVQGLNRFLEKSPTPMRRRTDLHDYKMFGESGAEDKSYNFLTSSYNKTGADDKSYSFLTSSSKKGDSSGTNYQNRKRGSSGVLDHSSGKRTSFSSMLDDKPLHSKRLSTLSIDEKAELIASKSKAAKLEAQMESIVCDRRRSDIEEENKRKIQSGRYAKDQEEIDILRRKYKALVEAKQAAVDEVTALQGEHDDMKKQLNGEIEQLQSEISHYKGCCDELEYGQNSEFSLMKEKYESINNEFDKCQKDLEEAEAKLVLYMRRVEDSKEIVSEHSELQSRCLLAEGKVKELQQKLVQEEEMNIVVKRSQTQLTKYRELEKENQALREDNRLYRDSASNSVILQEKINNLTIKVSKMDALKEKVQELEYVNEQLLNKLKTWEAPNAEGSDMKPRSPHEMTRIISELQTSHLNISGNNAQLEARMANSSYVLKIKDEECERLALQSTESVRKNEILEDKNQKLKRRLTLLVTERDGLRHVLSSYETEEGSAANKLQMQQHKEKVTQYGQQIKLLEDKLTAAKTDAASHKSKHVQSENELKMLKSLQEISPDVIKARIEKQQTSKDLDELTMKYKKVSEEKEVLEMRIEKKEMQGDYDPLRTRLLMLSTNPMKTAHEEFQTKWKNTEEENVKLRKKVIKLKSMRDEELEESMNVSKLIKSSKPMEEAAKQIEEWKLKYIRLEEEVTRQIRSFRVAVKNLLGYSLKEERENTFRLNSIYRDDPDSFFMLTCSQGKDKDKTIHSGLIETELVREFIPLFHKYVEGCDSIPAFLAAVNLALVCSDAGE